jgi:RNA polymerase sigma-70 factor (ECF subfamily)
MTQDGSPQSEPPDTQPVPDEYLQRMEAIGQARLCLDELDPRSRELVRLKFEECLSYKEISERTNVSISNVGFLLHHALKDLSASLKKAGVSL